MTINKRLDVDQYLSGILNNDRRILSKAITLVESDLLDDISIAQEIIEKCLPYSGKSFRIGITGPPGAGKSTFIETFGLELIHKGHKVAVLAIDPSSSISQGSILGDKTRMKELSSDYSAYIRPSASGEMYGGINRKTRESIILCESAGYDRIIVETVGVGQSEVIVESMVDFLITLMPANSGDEIQGIKRGILEMTDLLIFTKADGILKNLALNACREFKRALHYFPPKPNGWVTDALTCSTYEKEGFEEIFSILDKFYQTQRENNYLFQRRERQNLSWLKLSIQQELMNQFYQRPEILENLAYWEYSITNNRASPYRATQSLLNLFFKLKNTSK